MPEAHSEPNQILKRKIYVKTAVGLKPLTVFAKNPSQDVWLWLGLAMNTLPDAIEHFFYSTQMSLTCPKLAKRR